MDFTAHASTGWQVWTVTADGRPAYLYREGIPAMAARNWAQAWNEAHPADVPPGYTFTAVKVTTTYEAA